MNPTHCSRDFVLLASLLVLFPGCGQSDGQPVNPVTEIPAAAEAVEAVSPATAEQKKAEAQQKRDAKEKLLLLEKQQAQKQIDDLLDQIRKDAETVRSTSEKMEQLKLDWQAQRIRTWDRITRQSEMERDSESAQRRLTDFTAASKELQDKINDIDRQLKELYEEALRE
jgi:peptidoglycan hydrolase CwlO-like protein